MRSLIVLFMSHMKCTNDAFIYVTKDAFIYAKCTNDAFIYVTKPVAPLAISPKSGPFRRVFWVIRFSTFCTKTHFPENQKTDPKTL